MHGGVTDCSASPKSQNCHLLIALKKNLVLKLPPADENPTGAWISPLQPSLACFSGSNKAPRLCKKKTCLIIVTALLLTFSLTPGTLWLCW